MTKEYEVLIPLTGYVSVIVEAESSEEAKDKAFVEDFYIDLKSESNNVQLQEFETHEHIVRGNVFYGTLNEIEVEEIE